MTFPERIDRLFFDWSLHVGMWFVPLAAALTFGFAFARASASILGDWSILAGISAAIALEIGGILSFHVSEKTGSHRHLTYGYVLLGITGIWFLEDSQAFRTVGTIVFLVIPLAYSARSAAIAHAERKADQIKAQADRLQAQADQEDRQHKRDLQRLRLELAHERKMSQIQVSNSQPDTSSLAHARESKQRQIADRQQRVLSLLQDGQTQRQIADQVGVSLNTVKRDVKALNGSVRHG